LSRSECTTKGGFSGQGPPATPRSSLDGSAHPRGLGNPWLRLPPVPVEVFYEGLAVPQAIRKLAEHHGAPQTRHLSYFEYQLLHRAADDLDRRLYGRTT